MQHLRRLPSVVGPLALVGVLAGACASSDPHPGGVTEVREELAARRAATREVMDEGMAQPSLGDQAADAASGVWDFLGDAGDATWRVLSLQALGLW